MAVLYVRSTDGSDADNGTTWALAKATLAGAFAIAAAGDTIYVSQAHAETQATAMTLTSPGTAAAPCRVLCANDAAEPPTALATTGTLTTTVSSAITINGYCYLRGLSFIRSGTNSQGIIVGNATSHLVLEDCGLTLGSSSAAEIQFGVSGNVRIELIRPTLTFGNASQKIDINGGDLTWRGGSLGGTAPTTLFNPLLTPATVDVLGADLSLIGSGGSLVNVAVAAVQHYRFRNCKRGASSSLTTGTVSGPGITVESVNSDSADTNYRYEFVGHHGTINQETSIVRTGGASDGTTAYSRKLVSSANSTFFLPLEGPDFLIWCASTGSKTLTVEVITDGVTLTDAECWLEVEYLGTSGFPLSSFAHDRAADILATPANQTSSSVGWDNSGSFGSPIKQKLAVTFTVNEVGFVRARVMLAKASTTVYVDPPTVASLA